ncbi:hypothetical protein ACFE04_020614 [Oxalis oulophora]
MSQENSSNGTAAPNDLNTPALLVGVISQAQVLAGAGAGPSHVLLPAAPILQNIQHQIENQQMPVTSGQIIQNGRGKSSIADWRKCTYQQRHTCNEFVPLRPLMNPIPTTMVQSVPVVPENGIVNTNSHNIPTNQNIPNSGNQSPPASVAAGQPALLHGNVPQHSVASPQGNDSYITAGEHTQNPVPPTFERDQVQRRLAEDRQRFAEITQLREYVQFLKNRVNAEWEKCEDLEGTAKQQEELLQQYHVNLEKLRTFVYSQGLDPDDPRVRSIKPFEFDHPPFPPYEAEYQFGNANPRKRNPYIANGTQQKSDWNSAK